jgi:adenine deaminase
MASFIQSPLSFRPNHITFHFSVLIMSATVLRGLFLDIHARDLYPAALSISGGRIVAVDRCGDLTAAERRTLFAPGFVDAHVHCESTLLLPSEFKAAIGPRGTVAAICDPHEIANVLGRHGVEFMIRQAQAASSAALEATTLFWAVPSCVPALGGDVESVGGSIDANDVHLLCDEFPTPADAPGLSQSPIVALGEMMNFVALVAGAPGPVSIVAAARQRGLVVDGHAPGLTGAQLAAYVGHGVTSDHECSSLLEAEEKANAGMLIQIRSGSAAVDYPALHTLLDTQPAACALCTDDSHPDRLAQGHINQIVAQALLDGHDLHNVWRAASLNAIHHYNLGASIGTGAVGDFADLIALDLSSSLTPTDTQSATGLPRNIDIARALENPSGVLRRGVPVVFFPPRPSLPACLDSIPNSFSRTAESLSPADFCLAPPPSLVVDGAVTARVIVVTDGSLYTRHAIETVPVDAKTGQVGPFAGTTPSSLRLLAVVSRYNNTSKPSLSLVRGFGGAGAIATSVGHDSHNIIAVGDSPASLHAAVNAVVLAKGGLAVVRSTGTDGAVLAASMPLPVAGLMSLLPLREAAAAYKACEDAAHDIGMTGLKSCFISASFLALPVIPALKLTDKCLFDTETFTAVEEFLPTLP